MQYPQRKFPSLERLPVSTKHRASRKPRPVMPHTKRYRLSRKSSRAEKNSTARGKAMEHSTASFVRLAWREKVYQREKLIPWPVSSPNSTIFCHSTTPQAGSTVLPKRKTCLKGTRRHRSAKSFTASMGANTVRKLGLIPVQTNSAPASAVHCLAVTRSLYPASAFKYKIIAASAASFMH